MPHKVQLRNGAKASTTFSNVPQDKLQNKYDRVIFLLHGFPDNNSSYDDVWPIIANSFKSEKLLLLAPTMRGYEPSYQFEFDQYNPGDLAGDVYAWIQFLKIDKDVTKIHLVGHDWGAIATFKFASLYPELATSIVTLAIPYLANARLWHCLYYFPEQIWYSSYFLRMQYRYFYQVFEEPTFGANNYLNRLWSYWSPTWKIPKQAEESVRNTLLQPSVLDHATAYYRCVVNPLRVRKNRWAVDFDQVPALILGGSEDRCMSARIYEWEKTKLSNYKDCKIQLVDGIGHFLHREAPEQVGKLITEFLHQYS